MNTKTFTVKSTETAEVHTDDKGKVYASANCECGNYRRASDEQGLTVCFQGTQRVFAQGHDARLKSALITAGANEWKIERRHFEGTGKGTEYTQVRVSLKNGRERTVVWVEPIVTEVWTPTTAMNAAKDHGFGHQVDAGIRAAQAKAAKKAQRTSKPAVEAEPEADFDEVDADGTITEPTQGQVKVGRWWYDLSTGEKGENGGLLYIAKDGSILEAKAGAETR